MEEPALTFNDTPFHDNDSGNILLRFRELGYAVVHNAFDPDSVDPYLEQVAARVQETGNPLNPCLLPDDDPLLLEPAKAPRLLSMLRRAFSYDGFDVDACLFHPSWLVKPSAPDPKIVHSWHKDGDHECKAALYGYLYPRRIHAWIPFADVTLAHGPTYVIPGSHRDADLSPYRGAAEEPLLCGKGDVIIWDQRTWHRASPRTLPGLRIIAIFGFCSVPAGMRRTPGQRAAAAAAETDEHKILFDGPYGAADR
jgi:ectoine hydroxylase-related dioxygenase (phytanoyl-CoA dioxygenase family)